MTASHNLHANNPELAAEVGQRIRRGRERLGWTQRGMARRLAVSQGAVNSWESGYAMPRLEIVVALARVLQFTLDDLVSPARPFDTDEASA